MFETNYNNFGRGDHILSNVVIKLFIDGNCCFNQEQAKSIVLARGSVIEIDRDVFNCHKEISIAPTINGKIDKKPFDYIGFTIITVSIVVLLISIAYYCFVTTREIPEFSDDIDLDEEQIPMIGTTNTRSTTVLSLQFPQFLMELQ